MNTKIADYQHFSARIISWYRANPRDLPWRDTRDPYKIWLSEIILQQTRVAQGLPYYYAFSETYPTVGDLALASEAEVLRLWQGLGYYSRARNLHACAQYIWHELDGIFPKNYNDLLLLKGVGSYTAAAISSFAYGEVKAVVDGNVFRVLARYFGIETDIASGRAKREFESLANKIIPQNNPGEFNQAMMDFGAKLCVPKNPDCRNCPLNASCFANQKDMVKELPVKLGKIKAKERALHYFVIRCGEDWVWKKELREISGKDSMIFPMQRIRRSALREYQAENLSLFQKNTDTYCRTKSSTPAFRKSKFLSKNTLNSANGVKTRAI